MSFHHSMMFQIEGIGLTSPVRWRSFDRMISVFCSAEATTGATGYYVAPDPRIVVFLEDVSPYVLMSHLGGLQSKLPRPLARAIYIPAGVEMRTRFTAGHRFSHLDLHLDEACLIDLLASSIGRTRAAGAVRKVCEVDDSSAIEAIARLLIAETVGTGRHDLFAVNLAGALAAAILDLDTVPDQTGLLSEAQMAQLTASFDRHPDCRVAVGEMADWVGLSESHFAVLFKRTTGYSPSAWRTMRRIELAKTMLSETDASMADIAARTGFSDQAHLSRTFRSQAGQTPTSWRRTSRTR